MCTDPTWPTLGGRPLPPPAAAAATAAARAGTRSSRLSSTQAGARWMVPRCTWLQHMHMSMRAHHTTHTQHTQRTQHTQHTAHTHAFCTAPPTPSTRPHSPTPTHTHPPTQTHPPTIICTCSHQYPYDHNDVGGDDGIFVAGVATAGVVGSASVDGGSRHFGDPLCNAEAKPSGGWCNFTRVMW